MWYRTRNNIFFSLLLIVGIVGVVHKVVVIDQWWQHEVGSSIYQIISWNHNLLFSDVNDKSQLYSLSERTNQENWKTDLGAKVLAGPALHGNMIIVFTEDNKLSAISAKTGTKIWQITNPSSYHLTTNIQITDELVIAYDLNGTVYAFKLQNGEQVWQFFTIGSISPELQKEELSGTLTRVTEHQGLVYVATRDLKLIALNAQTGKEVWQTTQDSSFTSDPVVITNSVLISNKKGALTSYQKNTGAEHWRYQTETSWSCVAPINLQQWQWAHNLVGHLPLLFQNSARALLPQRLVIANQQGKIEFLDGKTGKTLWQNQLEGEFNCPTQTDGTLTITSKTGTITNFNLNDGRQNWSFDAHTPITTTPVVYRPPQRQLTHPWQPDLMYFGTDQGQLYALNAHTGQQVWSHQAHGALQDQPVFDHNHFYLASNGGSIYQYNANTGIRPRTPAFETDLISLPLIDQGIYELQIKHDSTNYANPWQDVTVSILFTHSSGKQITINGFFYDENEWRVRFNPPLKGDWAWKMTFRTPFGEDAQEGNFVSDKDTVGEFLHQDPRQPRRLTSDGTTIFNPIGLGDGLLDYNGNSYPLDDFAIGYPFPINASEAGRLKALPRVTSLETFAQTYGADGKLNLFRWSVDNASFKLWKNLSVTGNEYAIAEGKLGDEVAKTLTDKDLKIWLTIFGFGLPYNSEHFWPGELESLDDYVSYVVARYGAYVSVWEISNETYISDAAAAHLAQTIQLHDHEKRPISISFEKRNISEIGIISPHWYESEPLSQSDQRIKDLSSYHGQANKALIIGEQGNQSRNWDSTSDLRLRVRIWTSFFEEVGLIFWNQSDTLTYFNPRFQNGNMYLGVTERSYIRALQNFVAGHPLETKTTVSYTDNKEVRAYSLKSSVQLSSYLYHHTKQNTKTQTNVLLGEAVSGTAEWIDPATGQVIATTQHPQLTKSILSPPFTIDIAMKMKLTSVASPSATPAAKQP